MGSFRLVVLISGNGSNLQAIIDACQHGGFLNDCTISLVVSNKASAYGLERAQKANIPTLVRPWKRAIITREEYDDLLGKELLPYKPDLIVLAGWMHIFTPQFINQFPPHHIINLHPALPGKYPGVNAIERAYKDAQKGLIKETGCMIHTVTPIVDEGTVIVTKNITIDPLQPLCNIESAMHQQEHIAIVEAIRIISNSRDA